jgi:type IV pilus assembly protein PilY1
MMDITEPRNPKLMWERTYPELGMTTCIPSPMHIGPKDGTGEWYLVFGSGPTNYDYTTNLNGHVFVVDMKTGDPVGSNENGWLATSEDHFSYFSEPLVLDLFQSHNSDAIFLANNYLNGETWQSDIWKVAIPCANSKCAWDVDDLDDVEYSTNPGEWKVAKTFFKADGPISVQMNSTVDPDDNLLLYAGTGRYLAEDDKEDASQQYLYCIKDPFYFNKENSTAYHNFGTISSTTLTKTDLLQSDDIQVAVNYAGDIVSNYGSGTLSFSEFVEEVRKKENGWYLTLETENNSPSERIITQTAILGGIQVTPAYIPVFDVCGMGGGTSYIGTYYETGTGYTHQLFSIANPDIDDNQMETIAIRDDDLYEGLPAPKFVFHAGLEAGATITSQASTGEFVDISVNPAIYFKSMATEWWDTPEDMPASIEAECKDEW